MQEAEKYTIGQARDIESLSQGVNGLIMKGWQPTGGLCTATVMTEEGPTTMYVQAMIKPKSMIVTPRR